MKHNFIFVALGVLCVIFFFTHSTHGKNVHPVETKFKRQVEPLPETKIEGSDGQTQEKDEQSRRIVNIATTTEEIETKKKAEETENQQKTEESKINAPANLQEDQKSAVEGQASGLVYVAASPTKPRTPTKDDRTSEIAEAQASNKEVTVIRSKKDERDDLVPAPSNPIGTSATLPPVSEQKNEKSLFWPRPE